MSIDVEQFKSIDSHLYLFRFMIIVGVGGPLHCFVAPVSQKNISHAQCCYVSSGVALCWATLLLLPLHAGCSPMGGENVCIWRMHYLLRET